MVVSVPSALAAVSRSAGGTQAFAPPPVAPDAAAEGALDVPVDEQAAKTRAETARRPETRLRARVVVKVYASNNVDRKAPVARGAGLGSSSTRGWFRDLA